VVRDGRPNGRHAGDMAFVLLGILLIAVLVVAFLVQQRTAAARGRIEAGLAQLDVLRQDKANYYGQASKGPGQVRGIGALALTPDELVFFQLVPDAEVRVPRAAITHVEVARSFLDKAQNRDLLVVSWSTGDDQEPDRVAFDVADIDDWRADLKPTGPTATDP
jgi:hypothetical protein